MYVINNFDNISKAPNIGITIVIDVLRAFTTTAYILNAKAKHINVVKSYEEAIRIKKNDNKVILIGEKDGMKVEQFDYGNNPSKLINCDFKKNKIVFCTTNGTKGIFKNIENNNILVSSFVVADATIKYIKSSGHKIINCIITNSFKSEEDLAFSEYLDKKLNNKKYSNDDFSKKVLNSKSGEYFLKEHTDFPKEDLYLSSKINTFNFIMKVEKDNEKVKIIKESV